MDELRDEFRTQAVSTRRVGRAVPIATFLAGVFLGAALVKPWDLIVPVSRPAIDQPRPTPAADPRVQPSSTPSPSGSPGACAFAGGWRVFALGQPDPPAGDADPGAAAASDDPTRFADIGNPLRRWLEVDPLTVASGAGDGRIPSVTIVSDRIVGLGYCPPPDGTDGPPAGTRLDAWVLDGDRAPTALPLRPVTLDAAMAIEVPVFVSADDPAGDDARWASGRYIFALGPPDSGTYHRWFGVEIRTPPGRPSN